MSDAPAHLSKCRSTQPLLDAAGRVAAIGPRRSYDVETSVSAATNITPERLFARRMAIYRVLLDAPDEGYADHELDVIFQNAHTRGARPLRNDLMQAGLVERTELRRPTPAGNPAIVWRAVDPADLPVIWECAPGCPVAALDNPDPFADPAACAVCPTCGSPTLIRRDTLPLPTPHTSNPQVPMTLGHAQFATLHTVDTNIKGGGTRPEHFELGSRVTVFAGPIGAGKTRVVQALAWLLTGTIDDTGRKSASTATWEIDMLRPEGATSTWAKLSGSAGEVSVTLGLNAKTGRPNADEVVEGIAWNPMAFPVRQIVSWLQKDPKDAWTAFLPHIAWGIRGETIAAQVGEVALDAVEAATKIRLMMPTSLAALTTMRERADTEVGAADAEIKTITTQIAGMKQVLTTVGTTTEIEDLRERLKKMDAAILDATTAQGIPALREKLDGINATIQKGEEALVQRYPDPGPAPKGVGFLKLIEEGAVLRARAQALGMSVCPVSGVPWAAAKVDALNEVANKIRTATQDWQGKDDVHQRAKAKLQSFRDEATRIDGALAASQTAKLVPPETLEKWKAAREAAHTKLAQMVQSRDAYERIQQSEERMRVLAQVKLAWKGLYDACASAVQNLTQQNIENFVKLVQEAVPARFQVRIDTNIDGRSVFRPWLYDTAQKTGRSSSGGQRAILLVALTRAVLLTSQNLPPYVVIALPEERSFDGKSLGDLCRTLAKLDGPQIVLTNIDPPTGPMPPSVRVYTFDEAGTEVAPKARRGKGKAAEDAEPDGAVEPAVAAVVEPVAVAAAVATPAPTGAPASEPEPAIESDLWGTPTPVEDVVAAVPAAALTAAPPPELDALFADEAMSVPVVEKDDTQDDPEAGGISWDEGDGSAEPPINWHAPDLTPGAIVLPQEIEGDPFAVPDVIPMKVAPKQVSAPVPASVEPEPEVTEAKDISDLSAAVADALNAIFG